MDQFIFHFHHVIQTLCAYIILEKWIDFFVQAGIKEPTIARTFAEKFIKEKIREEVITMLT